MRILVLGGTAWLGRTIARTALDLGHEVTCLARGSAGRAPDGVRFVSADRDRPGAWDEVATERWDGVIDVSRQPGQVRNALAALGSATDRWVFVSTGNVYASQADVGDDETAPLLEPLAGDTMTSMELYGAAKVACELAVRAAFGDQAVIARSGLIGGPGDESGRSGYWPWRFAHPADPEGRVLVPATDLATSVIDVRDLARWLVDAVGDRSVSGTYDAVANRCSLPEHLAVARQVAGHTGDLVSAPDAWLVDHGVAEWSGPRSLPLWLADPEWQGFAGRHGQRILATGFTPRPLADTLADALAWEESRSSPGVHGAGLSDDDERELLAAAVPGATPRATQEA